LPDSVVGGDYFDYLTTTSDDDEQRSGIVISDAASKGLPAAIQALFVSGALRMGSGFQTKITSLISRLNNLIFDTFPYERFVTLCYCELTQSQNGLMLYCNAGHCSPIHYRRSSNTCVELEPTGPLLGIAPHQKYRVEGVNLERGDILVLFTDGIPEAQNEHEQQFGEKRIEEVITAHKDASARTLATMLLEEVQTFSAHGSYTVLSISPCPGRRLRARRHSLHIQTHAGLVRCLASLILHVHAVPGTRPRQGVPQCEHGRGCQAP
jgi:sigma-B regulation protein RsbU (phosphoserine phosphatase)